MPPLPNHIFLRALLQDELVVSTRDVSSDPRFSPLREHPLWRNVHGAMMLVPLKFRAHLLGFFAVEHGRAMGVWKGDEETFVSSCAIQCTMVLGSSLHIKDRHPAVTGSGMAGPEALAADGGEELAVDRAVGVRWETDLAGCIKALEGDVAGLFGYAPEALLGQPVTFLSEKQQGERDLAQLQRILSGEACVGYETRLRTVHGADVRLQVWAEVQRDTTGRVVGVRGSAVPLSVPVS